MPDDFVTASDDGASDDRRSVVLRSALTTFARFGYRKASMDDLAHDANISRPGLYYLFSSKKNVFVEAADLCVREDLAAAEGVLSDLNQPLNTRLLHAFDHWAGRYVGPLTREISSLLADNREELGLFARSASDRFSLLVNKAISAECDAETSQQITQTLISASKGIKGEVETRSTYLERMAVAIDLINRP